MKKNKSLKELHLSPQIRKQKIVFSIHVLHVKSWNFIKYQITTCTCIFKGEIIIIHNDLINFSINF